MGEVMEVGEVDVQEKVPGVEEIETTAQGAMAG